LRHKKTVLIGFTGVFIVSLFMAQGLQSEFAPEEDTGDVRMFAHLPIGTRVEETDQVARRIEGILKAEVPERTYLFSRSGEVSGIGRTTGQASGTHIIYTGVKLVPKDQRKRGVKEVANVLRTKVLAIPGVMRLDVMTGSPIGQLITGTGGKSIQVEIVGHSFEETDAIAGRIKAAVEKIPGAVDVAVSRESNRPELKIEVDREKAGTLGLDMNSIAYAVKTFIEGSIATRYREKGQSYDIVVRLEEASRSKVEDIENLFVTSPVTGRAIKLGNVARIVEIKGPEEIERLNRERVVKVECSTFGRAIGNVAADIKKEIDRMAIPPGIVINIGGEIEEMQKSMRDLLLLLLLGIALVYMVMAAQFESFLDPFIIMFAMPFTFTGVIFALLMTGLTVSIISVFGVVMLMGIVVNNAIVLVSYINILRARGYSVYDAITLGGKDRLRPVLMTTVTTLAGLLPLAFSRGEGSETWRPLGMTMLGGLSVSTLITMLFVPTLYAVFEERVKASSRKNGVKT
jgi:multidrug efflux pump subunit AcrB